MIQLYTKGEVTVLQMVADSVARERNRDKAWALKPRGAARSAQQTLGKRVKTVNPR